MQQKMAIAMFALLLISNIGASAPANENVLHPNIVRAMDSADTNTEIEFIVQYRPQLTEQHIRVAEEIGIEIISTFEFIDGFFGKATASQIRDLSKQEDIFWICLLYTSPSPRDRSLSRMPSSA